MYSTVVSDVGTVRSNNQDSAFAGEHLIAICDGMGGHAGGDTASTIAIRSLAHIEQDNVQGDVQIIAHMMETSVMAAHDAIVGKAKRERRLAGMGTTVTSVALVAGYWVLAHIGDSRAYLLHDGRLIRMTSDHSYVQHLIDTGRISEAEARNHPQRNVVMRVLGDFDIDSRPDIAVRKAHPSDRWLLCSDGLCGVLEDSTLQEVLSTCSDQEECAQQLVSMALRAGSTDNVTAVIADATLALDADAFDLPHQTPLVGGAASASLEPIADIINEPVASAPALREGKKSPAARAAALRNGKNPNEDDNPPEQRVAQPSTVREENGDRINPDTGEIPVVQKDDGRISADPNDPEVAKAIRNEHIEQRKTKRTRTRRNRVIAIIVTIVGITSWQSSYPALVRSLWLTYVMTVFWLTVYRFMPQLFRKGAFVIGKNTLPILLFSPAFTIITKLFVPLFTFDPTVILFTITAVAFTVCGCLLTAKAMDYLRISPYFCGKDHFFCRK